jgi:tryptophanyl-tRNA synthetase
MGKMNPLTNKPVVLSGVQPSGELHLGNYIGALRPWARGQAAYENYFCVVDLHALTIPEALVGQSVRQRTRQVAALYLACGIDPATANIFAQSDVPEHTELMWLLNCVTPLGWLERMTQFKAKSARRATVGSGLLTYPVLMAADILLYRADIVPVGDDQKQHIELTRDLAERFNSMFGKVFVVPEASIPLSGARVMGLDDPTEKMSKSVERANHAINLLDDESLVRRKISRAKTDAGTAVDPGDISAGLQNLIEIRAGLADDEPAVWIAQYAGQSYGAVKSDVAAAINATLQDIQLRYQELIKDEKYIDEMLARGAVAARRRARPLVQSVRAAMGLD